MATVGFRSRLDITASQTISSSVVTSYQVPVSVVQTLNYTQGTGAGAADLIHSKSYSLAGSAQSIDLTAIADLSGSTVNMARVREIIIVMKSVTSGHILTIDTTVSNGFKVLGDGTTGNKTRLFANASTATTYNKFQWQDKDSTGGSTGGVTSGTSKVISLDPGANTFTVDVVILGCSATS